MTILSNGHLWKHTEFIQNKNFSFDKVKILSLLSKNDIDEAYSSISNWEGYSPTPLLELHKLSKELNLNKIFYKDESKRFNLKSFKALGGAYAVEKVSKGNKDIVVASATDGNHGRAVAYGAKLFGCKCQVFIHSEVSLGRQKAMESLGAIVIRISGNYDKSLRACKEEASINNWYVISDTSYEGYTKYPKYIMAGYTVMAKELEEQLKNNLIPTHMFLQAGVGSFPASICSYFWQKNNTDIKNIIVESKLAPCLLISAQNNKLSSYNIIEETIMAGLSCGEPSLLGWKILNESIDHFITIDDTSIKKTMKLLNKNTPQIEAGESSVAGLASLIDLKNNKDVMKSIGLNHESVILLFGTEGATDPQIYKSIIES